MKLACPIITIFIIVGVMALCLMIKFATEITNEGKKEDAAFRSFARTVGMISLKQELSDGAKKMPYVAAVINNSTKSWAFACFASVIHSTWIVTTGHCRTPGLVHRVLLYQHYMKNYSQTYPIVFWRVHESYNVSTQSPKYDIAVAKMNTEENEFTITSAFVNALTFSDVVAAVWKTVRAMNLGVYLTNDFEIFDAKTAAVERCYEAYGVLLDDSMVCIDMSNYDDCFTHEFGPLFSMDRVVGVLAAKPVIDCEMKYMIFTNVSYYSDWILTATAE